MGKGKGIKTLITACSLFGFIMLAIWNIFLIEEIKGCCSKRDELRRDLERVEILEESNRIFAKDVLRQKAIATCFLELIERYEKEYDLKEIHDCIQLIVITDEKFRNKGLDAPLIFAWLEKESAGNPRAVSCAGAKGLTQLMDFRAEEVLTAMGYPGHDIELVYNPAINLDGGIRHLSDLMIFWRSRGIKNQYLALFYAIHSYKWGTDNTVQLFNSDERAYRPAIEYVNWIFNRREYWQEKLCNLIGRE
jgi:hypothetical protein